MLLADDRGLRACHWEGPGLPEKGALLEGCAQELYCSAFWLTSVVCERPIWRGPGCLRGVPPSPTPVVQRSFAGLAPG